MNPESIVLKRSPKFAFWAFSILVVALICAKPIAAADSGFSGGVTPSRFEINADAGDIVRRSLEIYNLGQRPAKFQIATVDWTYSETGQITYSNPLSDDSCRPWVRLEGREIDVVPNPRQPRDFRFEVHVPDDAKAYECRFALMIESVDSQYTTEFAQAGIKLPVTGRIAVIVYLAIGGVQPEITIQGMEVKTVNGRNLPVVKVSNIGAAHGRLDSDLKGRDKEGNLRQLSVATSPILAGQTRYMVVSPVENTQAIDYPLTIQGKIYAPNSTFAIDSILRDP